MKLIKHLFFTVLFLYIYRIFLELFLEFIEFFSL